VSTEHAWKPAPDLEVSICEKCGMVRLKALNGVYVFVRWLINNAKEHAECSSPYHREEEAKTE
jgi:hypothetical protein